MATKKTPGKKPTGTKTAAKTTTAKTPAAKEGAKRFRVLLEQLRGSTATWFTLPFDAAKFFGTRGRVPVRCTVNGFPLRTSIFPTGDGTHYMVLNRDVRAGAKVKGGETVTVKMERDTEPRVITPHPDLARALKANREARAAWDKLSYSNQREHARSVEEAKRPETRQRRVERAIAVLAAGNKPRG